MSEALAATAADDDGKITCQIDGAKVHAIQTHLKNNHPDWTIERYKAEYPMAPLLSKKAEQQIQARRAANAAASGAAAAPAQIADAPAAVATAAAAGDRQIGMMGFITKAFHELFELGNAPAALSSLGKAIPVELFNDHTPEDLALVPKIDDRYVFNIDLTKKVLVGFKLGFPVYLWGYHGTGKTTVLEQAAARTRRPFSRVQHSQGMDESHVLGQWIVKNGETVYQLGPLPEAMLRGHVYCADEYDFALPGVIAIYQSVLEGKPLVIKDAPPEYRVITPHPQFRFVATGNTNGVGDETGLYQGTMIQNAANFSRFPITEEVRYMEAAIETSIVISQAGVQKDAATKIVQFANKVREEFKDGKIGMTISPRELISAAKLALVFGNNWQEGLKLAYVNRLSRADQNTINQFIQRIFGDK